MSGARSPSPVLTRPTNPNLRGASETTSSIRRSFTGNPFARPSVHTSPRSFVPNTPANSPAEFGRKLPLAKEGSMRGFEEKENEKMHNLKAIKCKSPLKASKNFMSPTISAASKFTPSPRKKILGERNESVRTSISFSDSQESSVSDIDTKSELGFDQNVIEGSTELAGFHKKEVFKASKKVTFSDKVDEVLPITHHEPSPYNNFYSSSMSPVIAPNEVSETPNKADKQSDHDSVVLDSSLDPKPFCSPMIAPLDADPSFPPYDPKTNYLSPRPQFLRYKPKHRMDIYLSEESLNFEESKESEDSDVTEETETESGDSQKESEDGLITETLPSEEDALLLSEPTTAGTPVSDHMLKQDFEAQPDSFTISKSEEELLLSEPTFTGSPISTQMLSDHMLKQDFEAQPDSFTISKSEEELLLSEPTFTGSPISTQMLKPGSIASLKSEEEKEALLSEPTPSGTPISAQMLKPGFFTRSKCISLLLVLLIACVSISVTDVSITSSPLMKNLSSYKLYESSEVAALARKKIDMLAGNVQHWCDTSETAVFARESFDGLLRNFQQWHESSDVAIYANKYLHGFARGLKQYSSQTISYICKLIPRLGEVDKSISLQYCNLTDSQEHSVKAGYFEINHQKKVAEIHDEYELNPMVKEEAARDYPEVKAHSANVFNEQNGEESELHKMFQAEMNYFETAEEVLDPEQLDTELRSNTESEDRSANVFNEQNEEESELQKMFQAEMNYFETAEEVLDPEQIDTELQSNTESEDRSAAINEYNEEESEVRKMIQAESYTEEVLDLEQFDTELQSNTESEDQSVLQPEVVSQMEFQINNDASTVEAEQSAETAISEVGESKPSAHAAHAIVGISFLVLSVVVASAFAYLKQGKNTTAVNDVVYVEPKQTKNLQNSPTNYDMSGESCSSEMSSFQNTSSHNKGSLKRMNKAQSQERKSRVNTKRESLASSSEFSTGSPSYGSFTTYERIPVKHTFGEEELVTPVRRSSRIRSQITTSP